MHELHAMNTTTTVQQLIAKAREYVGTPFHHQGRLKGVGVDCVGLLVCVARELGLSYTDEAGYRRIPDGVMLMDRLCSKTERVTAGAERVGDIAVFWMARPDRPQHVGLLTDVGIIHAFQDAKRVVEHTLGDYWCSRYLCSFRFHGLVDEHPTPATVKFDREAQLRGLTVEQAKRLATFDDCCGPPKKA